VATLTSGALWLGLLILATYRLGKEVHSRRSGLLAAAIVSLYPLVVALERDFLLDLPLAAMVTLALWLLLRCGSFDHRGRAMVLGLALGLGTLVKWPFSFFLVAPLLAAVYQIARRGGSSWKRLINLGLCLVIGGSLAASQYLFNLLFLPKELYNLILISHLVTSFAGAAGHPPWYTLSGLIYYGMVLVNHQVTFFFALLFLASLPAFFRAGIRGRLVSSLSIGIPYILATLLPVKEQRITMPYLPVIAVITAVGLARIQRTAVRTGVIVVVLSVGLIQFWANSYGVPVLPSHVYLRTSLVEIALFDQHSVRSPRDFSLQPASWKHVGLLAVIKADAETRGVPLPVQVPLVSNTATYNPNTLNYYSILHDAGIEFLYVWSWYGEALQLQGPFYPYLVLKSGENTDLEEWDEWGIERIQAFLDSHQSEYTPIYTAPLPDDSEIFVYRRESALEQAD
jgi:4-amino-4-deoxy-L-arabinose transferase-like glycosyltransferase